ncbi:MAG: TonB-dependent receptor [Pseudomonadota bacterium]
MPSKAVAPPAESSAAGQDEIQKVIIVSTGSRGAQRTMVDTPVPVDILSARDLGKTGQATLDKALQFRVPSFNTVQTPVNDATSLLDPYEIRNMGPSRVLILINGKRKNASALIYTQTSPGRGESGADISAIPQDAIKRIEVLRDGASAQYGSDAIAGVVNIILKDNAEGGAVTLRTGMTHDRDGKMGGVSLNQGVALGDSGFINYTLDVSKIGLARRSGLVNAKGEAGDFGADLNKDVLPFLAKFPDAGNINGSPATEAMKALVNSRYDIGGDMSLYGNAAYIHKQVDSYANYRTPYWRPTDYGLLHPAGSPYLGYVPTFVGKLDDYNATGGLKFGFDGWTGDVSVTYGGNEQSYGVHNSVNRGMEDAFLAGTSKTHSPTSFDAGGVKFSHWVLNGDLSKQVTSSVNAFVGTELRHERYEVVAGEPASYLLGGADSYAGNSPDNSFPSSRSNYGAYAGASWDISNALALDGTGRYEKYSDFGSAFVWKAASRLKVSDSVTIRGSASTGFRAPSLAQIYTQKAQYSFVPGSGIQVSGLVNNVSAQAVALGVPKLQAEKSENFTLGLGLKPDSDTSMTFDFYSIKVKNRIILGKEIVPSGDPTQTLDKILKANGIVSVSFFVNALTSQTSGIDYVLSRKNMTLAGGKLTLNLSGNYSLKNERDGNVQNPSPVAKAGQSVLDETQEALMFTSRPKFKTIVGADLDYDKFNLSLNNTTFGPTYFRNAGLDRNLEVAFKTKNVTDFAINYQINKNTTFTFNLNNILNVTPEWHFNALNSAGTALLNSKVIDPSYNLTPVEIQRNLVTFNGRYAMVTYDGSQFSQLGRTYAASLNWRF